jgi:hypothetical protein
LVAEGDVIEPPMVGTVIAYATAGFPDLERLEAERARLAAGIADAERQRDAAQKSAIVEAEGIEGTMQPGFGRVYLEKREYLDSRVAELNRVRKESESRIRAIESKLADKRAERDSAASMLMSARNRGAAPAGPVTCSAGNRHFLPGVL